MVDTIVWTAIPTTLWFMAGRAMFNTRGFVYSGFAIGFLATYNAQHVHPFHL